jgi:hypothetical protein
LINVFAVDPGTRSGVAWGSVPTSGTIKERLCAAEICSATFEGSPRQQAIHIEENLYNFLDRYGAVDLVIEDFILRKMTADRELLDPIRITSGLLALIDFQSEYNGKIEIHFQQPSMMASITSDRLRLWNLWVRGSDPALEHHRHLAAFVAEQVRVSSGTGRNA